MSQGQLTETLDVVTLVSAPAVRGMIDQLGVVARTLETAFVDRERITDTIKELEKKLSGARQSLQLKEQQIATLMNDNRDVLPDSLFPAVPKETVEAPAASPKVYKIRKYGLPYTVLLCATSLVNDDTLRDDVFKEYSLGVPEEYNRDYTSSTDHLFVDAYNRAIKQLLAYGLLEKLSVNKPLGATGLQYRRTPNGEFAFTAASEPIHPPMRYLPDRRVPPANISPLQQVILDRLAPGHGELPTYTYEQLLHSVLLRAKDLKGFREDRVRRGFRASFDKLLDEELADFALESIKGMEESTYEITQAGLDVLGPLQGIGSNKQTTVQTTEPAVSS